MGRTSVSLSVWLVVVAVVLSEGCTPGRRTNQSTLRYVNRVTLALSTAMIACDGASTYRAADANWMAGSQPMREKNPILGPEPSRGEVIGYFAVAAGVNALIWAVMPERYKSLVPIGVTGLSIMPVANNVHGTGTVCGIGSVE